MYNTYDEYVAATAPKYIQTCKRCGRVYFSHDGEDWADDDRGTYNSDPVKGGTCINCECTDALNDPQHWAAQEVLCTEKALMWVIHDAIRYSGEDRQKVIVKLFQALAADEDFAESMKAYLDEHYSDVYSEVEAEF